MYINKQRADYSKECFGGLSVEYIILVADIFDFDEIQLYSWGA